ncbi:unnamed protein product, partial [Medioppia subpectinata]
QEVPLCGHATVGTTYALYAEQTTAGRIKQFNFTTKSGRKLTANSGRKLTANVSDDSLVTLSMPSILSTRVHLNDRWTQTLIKTLGKDVDESLVDEVCKSSDFAIIVFKDSANNRLLELKPDFDAMNSLERNGIKNGIVVTQRADYRSTGFHFYSRVFLPWVGLNEDLVCGHAHTQLTPYWAQRLAITGQTLVGKQCSRRPGIVRCRINGDSVDISGNAVIVLKGTLIL